MIVLITHAVGEFAVGQIPIKLAVRLEGFHGQSSAKSSQVKSSRVESSRDKQVKA